jgi:hypothetical protein
MKYAMLLFFAAGLAAAQSAPVKCPIQFKVVETRRWVPDVGVGFWNRSDKVIVGVKFQLQMFDATGDPAKSPFEYVSAHKVKPGKYSDPGWTNAYLERPYMSHKATMWLQKAMFEDGTTWEDDGTHSCSMTSK